MPIKDLVEECSRGLVDRRPLVEAIVLAAVAREHVLVIGPPGTAKSEAARRVSQALGGRYFEYLLGKFTEPSEIFGPVDLRRLKEGVLETAIEGMLPEAEIAFLDEVFAGSTAILNSLLGLLNERTFRRGNTHLRCPLRVCIGASNALPQDESLAAFADRFLIRCFVDPVSDPMLEALLSGGRGSYHTSRENGLQELDALTRQAETVDLEEIRPRLASALRRLRKEGLALSDRRCVRVQNLVAAAAALAGRQQASAADLWPLVLAVPTAAEQEVARQCLEEELKESNNPNLWSLAEDASAAPQVRARRLQEAATAVLQQAHPDPLRVEGILREIDATLHPTQIPAELSQLRDQLRGHLT